MNCRALCSTVVVACAMASSGVAAWAQPAYPSRAITLVVPVAAGGAADALARSWAEHVGAALGQPVVVDNRPGANGSVAASYVAKQAPNGYTVLFASTSNMSLNPFSYKSLSYDPLKDFDPVSMLAGTSQVLVTSTATGIRSLDDLVKAAKRKSGGLDFGSAGKGNSTHLNVEFVAQHYGLKMTHVPYKGAAPAMVGLIGGETQLVADAVVSVVPQVKGGRVVPLLIFGSQRSKAFPDVPTVFEAGLKDYPAGGWYGLMVPRGTPKEVVARLNGETAKFWADPGVKQRMDALYMDPPSALGPDAVTQTMKKEAAVWGPVITRLGIQND
ncbi:Bug family tripartite tricarboxylate transporter substrate binding protein [Variovorax sp. IB41]|uniref:Bug family tripartite tricarboxylate transporter substrate binding protein n=1 Tax=Variovorax sp. IB41 TaxID=2779370 RepID=UPI0018E8CAE3|nr:tripartite tricarboxylate transporter substrate binding protein [Variovorax sp. IB41]MBJ2156791.1 tripartite tricarboxylate transporter substrate binding protein [Variovorax sp. IB41]